MRLKNVAPSALVGRTIIYHFQFWNVRSVSEDTQRLLLGRDWSQDKGVLRFDQMKQCRLYPSSEEVCRQHPFLLRALRWSCILSHGEAEGAVLGYITTGSQYMGSEAVAHVGGSLQAIRHALRCRHAVRRQALSNRQVKAA